MASPGLPRLPANQSEVTSRSGWAYALSVGLGSAGRGTPRAYLPISAGCCGVDASDSYPSGRVGHPQLGDRHTDTFQQHPGLRQAQADDVGRVAFDAVDEPTAQPVQGECSGDRQWLAAVEIGI